MNKTELNNVEKRMTSGFYLRVDDATLRNLTRAAVKNHTTKSKIVRYLINLNCT
jgi:hypothetical protein